MFSARKGKWRGRCSIPKISRPFPFTPSLTAVNSHTSYAMPPPRSPSYPIPRLSPAPRPLSTMSPSTNPPSSKVLKPDHHQRPRPRRPEHRRGGPHPPACGAAQRSNLCRSRCQPALRRRHLAPTSPATRSSSTSPPLTFAPPSPPSRCSKVPPPSSAMKREALTDLGYPADVVERARRLLKDVKSVGAYSNRCGRPGHQGKSVADFIGRRCHFICFPGLPNWSHCLAVPLAMCPIATVRINFTPLTLYTRQ